MTAVTTTTKSTSSTEKLVSACAGALVTSLLVTPMDVIKLRLQTQQQQSSSQQATICCQKAISQSTKVPFCSWLDNINHATLMRSTKRQVATLCAFGHVRQPLILKGTLDGLYKIIRYEGAPALWKGLSPALVMSIPANVIYFVGYDYLRDMIRPYTSANKRDYSPLVAGGVARTVAVAVISPIELFRTRLQATTTAAGVNDFKNVLQGVIKMVEQSGPRALWRGLPPTLYRDVPFSAIYWMGYEESKKALLAYNADVNGVQASFLAGAVSGMIAAAVTTPFDVAKTQRQVYTGHGDFQDTHVPAILKQIYRRDGVHGLFRGLSARLAKVAPSCAIMIYFYELGKSFFAHQRP